MPEGYVKANREILPGYYLLELVVDREYPVPTPGQFVMLNVSEGCDPLLRRPFSVYNFYQEQAKNCLKILYRVVGRGTEMMSHLKVRDLMRLSTPLGNGFHFPTHIKRIYLVGGGVGVAPLVYLAHFVRRSGGEREIVCYLGAQTEKKLLSLETLKSLSSQVIVATDDGSAGFHGPVTEAFRKDLGVIAGNDTAVYVCGPREMVQEFAAMLKGKPIFCQVSMEERMACGLGACLGCVISLQGREGNRYYGRVCVDGPVFNIRHIIWEG